MMPTIQFYVSLVLRRLHWILIIFTLCTAAAVTIASKLPPVFTSSSTLLVEPPQIPQNLASSTVEIDPRQELQVIEQRLMTRVNLIDIARSENVFPNIAEMTLDEVEAQMRRATNIVNNARPQQATIMSISFEADRAAVTANVVNRYVTIILQDNVRNRTKQASDTLEFFEGEVDRLSDELGRKSAEILAFNNENADALPSSLNFRMSQQASLQTNAAVLGRDIANLEDQKQRLLEIFQETGSVSGASTGPSTPAEQRLAQLQQQLNDALAVYSENNPRVRLLRAQVEQQEQVVDEQLGLATNNSSSGTGTTVLDVQLAGIDAQIEVYRADLEDTQAQLERLNETIDRTPSVQIQLDALNRDYENIQTQYNQAVSGLARAATGERIELLAQGQRITVIDPATVPASPSSPNRLRIAIAGSFAGLVLGVGLALGLALLNNAIRRPAEITARLGITPLATIPYVRTPMELVARRAMVTGLFLVVVIGLPALLYAVHTYYLPLDLIYEKITARIGTIL